MTGLAQSGHAARHQAYTRLVILNFFRYADDHWRTPGSSGGGNGGAGSVAGTGVGAGAGASGGASTAGVSGDPDLAGFACALNARLGPNPIAINDSDPIFPSGLRF